MAKGFLPFFPQIYTCVPWRSTSSLRHRRAVRLQAAALLDSVRLSPPLLAAEMASADLQGPFLVGSLIAVSTAHPEREPTERASSSGCCSVKGFRTRRGQMLTDPVGPFLQSCLGGVAVCLGAAYFHRWPYGTDRKVVSQAQF